MRYKCFLLYFSLFALLFLTAMSGGVQSDAGAINLEADSIRYDESTGSSFYNGNVIVRRDRMLLTGDEVEAFSKGNSFSRIIARANPSTFQNRDKNTNINAEAKQIEYDIEKQIIIFLGDAKVDDGKRVIQGERVIYNIKKKIMDATKSKGRVRLKINP